MEGVLVGAGKRTGLAAIVAVLTLSGAVSALADTPADAPPADLVEATTCAAPTPLVAPDGSRSDGDTQVSFQVPAIARLRVADGHVVAAATNTGCAPRATDQVV